MTRRAWPGIGGLGALRGLCAAAFGVAVVAAPLPAAAEEDALSLPLLTVSSPPAATAPAGRTVTGLGVRVVGLGWTRAEPLKAAIDTAPGSRFDPGVFDRDLQRLRDYEIFRDVTGAVHDWNGGVTATVTVEDRWGVVPVFRPLYGADIFSLKLGARDTNFLGRTQDLAVYAGPYISPVSNSFLFGVIWLFRQFMGRNSLYLSAERDYGVISLYDGSATAATNIEVVVAQGYGQFFYKRHDRVQPGVLLAVTDRRYTLLDGAALPAGLPAHSLGIRPGLLLRLGEVNYNRYRYEGLDATFGGFREIRGDGPPGYWGGFAIARGFLLPHPRLNLGARLILESRDNTHTIDDLNYGGLAHVRGYPNSYLRGRHAALLNAEVRLVAWDALLRAFFVQFAVFYDGAVVARRAGDPWHGAQGWNDAHGVGVGLRGAIVQIYGMYLRLDAARALTDGRFGPDVNLGIEQFF